MLFSSTLQTIEWQGSVLFNHHKIKIWQVFCCYLLEKQRTEAVSASSGYFENWLSRRSFRSWALGVDILWTASISLTNRDHTIKNKHNLFSCTGTVLYFYFIKRLMSLSKFSFLCGNIFSPMWSKTIRKPLRLVWTLTLGAKILCSLILMLWNALAYIKT